MVRVEPGSFPALFTVAHNLREADVVEFCAINPVDSAADLARLLIKRYRNRDDTFAAFDGGVPVAFGCMVEARPNVITGGFFATDKFPHATLGVARFITRILFPAYRKAGVHRIECAIIAGHGEACRFVELLGLTEEAVLRGYGKRGEAFVQYAWVA